MSILCCIFENKVWRVPRRVVGLTIMWCFLCNGFMSKNPLRNIVISKAVSNTVVENLSSELFDNTILINQMYSLDDNHDYFPIYLAGFLWYKLYSGVKSKINNNDDKKLVVFDSYIMTRRITRQILFVLFLLLSKNVHNVY